jgi:hypothetical protein
MQPAAIFFLKLSKQLAFLTCVLILSRASARADIDQIWIFAAASLASLLNFAGRAIGRARSGRLPIGSGAR